MFHTSQKIPLSQITELNFAFSQITDFKKGQSHVTEKGPARKKNTIILYILTWQSIKDLYHPNGTKLFILGFDTYTHMEYQTRKK